MREVLAADPNHVYGGLLNVLMRLVFILYAEDRGLLSSDPVYANFYSVTGLFERLREDAGRYPDTMDQRYGAWAQLLTLFRLIYDGGQHDKFHVPPRRGYLFDPDRYPFLEGRKKTFVSSQLSVAKTTDHGPLTTDDCQLTTDLPRVSDGVLFRVLSNLLILDGERLSYRTLDVEQIGSVYEAVMGFHLQVAEGRSIAVKPTKSHGAPATINLEALLEQKPADRLKWLAEQTDQKFTGQAAEGLKKAESLEDLLAALEKKIARYVTPNVVPKGAMVLQPSDERRRSGSHYTPRSLTEPIVRTTLRPILEKLSQVVSGQSRQSEKATDHGPLTTDNRPTPEQILELNVCDPAMGSGAFLVETCRQLGDELVKAWHVHNCAPKLPPDEDEVLHARRLIAQRCLYGVDKNPMAVDLAKLSLWLATLAKDHPFTFLDHSLRCGDSLVGLSREQIAAFHWEDVSGPSSVVSGKKGRRHATDHGPRTTDNKPMFGDPIAERMRTVTEYRQRILAARDDKPYEQLRQELDVADEALSLARLAGDAVIAAYFSAGKDRERVAKLDTLARQLVKYLGPQGRIEDRQPLTEAVASLHSGDHPIQPFHWQIEFPEVFTVDAKGKPTGGFDAIVGNPPFFGGTKVSASLGQRYLGFLLNRRPAASGNADLAAHFLSRMSDLTRINSAIGLITTNSVLKREARSLGIDHLANCGFIFTHSFEPQEWPFSSAAVVFIVVQAIRLSTQSTQTEVSSPIPLSSNEGLVCRGCDVVGSGFALSSDEFAEWQRNSPESLAVIRPYLGGADFTDSPVFAHSRYIIDFEEMSIEEARRFTGAFARIEQLVKPARATVMQRDRRELWWLYVTRSPELRKYFLSHTRCIATAQLQKHFGFGFVPRGATFPHTLVLFLFDSFGAFSVLQGQIHYFWISKWGGTMGLTPRYTTRTCFDTFPFAENFETDAELEAVGKVYYEFRAALMVRNDEGLTKTYNRFHDPHETLPDILKLRELHAAMDRAVLEAYGWHDLADTATCEFLLDYEDDEDEEELSPQPSRKGRGKKKPWRYRWPDEFRDEVLARLLALNKERAEQERLAGQTAAVEGKQKKPSRRKGKPKHDGPELFE